MPPISDGLEKHNDRAARGKTLRQHFAHHPGREMERTVGGNGGGERKREGSRL